MKRKRVKASEQRAKGDASLIEVATNEIEKKENNKAIWRAKSAAALVHAEQKALNKKRKQAAAKAKEREEESSKEKKPKVAEATPSASERASTEGEATIDVGSEEQKIQHPTAEAGPEEGIQPANHEPTINPETEAGPGEETDQAGDQQALTPDIHPTIEDVE